MGVVLLDGQPAGLWVSVLGHQFGEACFEPSSQYHSEVLTLNPWAQGSSDRTPIYTYDIYFLGIKMATEDIATPDSH